MEVLLGWLIELKCYCYDYLIGFVIVMVNWLKVLL